MTTHPPKPKSARVATKELQREIGLMSFDDIAAKLGVSHQAVWKCHANALRKMREAFTSMGMGGNQ